MRKYGKWLLVLAVLAAVPAVASADGFLGGRQQATATGNPAQSNLNQQQAEQVKQALQNANIDGYGINIEVIDGVVKLNGKVRKPGHLARAGKVCQQLPGITRVVNQLEYVPQRKARAASSGTLMGRLAGRLAGRSGQPAAAPAQRSQPAIQQVKAVAPPTGPSNQQVAEQIGGALKQAGLAGQSISITFQKGVVTLSGGVNSPAQRSAAGQAAGQVRGVTMVNNQLKVAQAAPQTAFAAQQQAPQVNPVSYGQQLALTGYPQQAPPVPPSPGMAPQAPQMSQVQASPVSMGGAGLFSHPQLPSHAWPAYAQYPNSAAVTYPTQYSASAFPYIGPFYPYPQVPLGWREAKLQWDDGFWNLNFNKTDSVWSVLFSPGGG
ncbi:MAG: BON domain-containing protein [Planctomycetaceae bacterium]